MKAVGRNQLEYHLLVFATLALVAFGLVMVYSSSSARAVLGDGDPTFFLKQQGIAALLGLVCLALCSRFGVEIWQRLSRPLLAASFALLGLVLVSGTSVNGARRWLSFGPLDFQPSELTKLALALWVATLLVRRPAPRSLRELARPLGLVVGVACALILVEPDLGTAIAIVLMVGAMVLVAGAPLRLLVGSGALASLALLAAIWTEDYRRARFFAFLHPWSDPQDTGYQIIQAQIAFASGGLSGRGLGEGIQKASYLPEASTDMILAIVGEELGLLGVACVLLAFAALGYAGFSIALRSRDTYSTYLAAGLTTLIVGQAAVNACAVLGLVPITGIPLPFVSYGGTSLIVMLAAVGILLNIAVTDAPATAHLPDRRRRNSRTRPAGTRSRRGAAGTRGRRPVRGLA